MAPRTFSLHQIENGFYSLSHLNRKSTIRIACIVVALFLAYIAHTIVSRPDVYSRSNYPFNQLYSESWINIDALIENGIAQNDSRIVARIKERHLFAPPSLPYNLSYMTGDPGVGIYAGQNIVVKKILKNMTNGYFVDVGAHDGEYISNTLTLERDFNWTGLLIEPSPIELPNLISKHRKAWVADVCLSPLTVPSTFTYLHRINYTIASKLKDKETEKDLGNIWKEYRIQCFPFFSILSAMGIMDIDYFSLDIEGVELKVLNTIPFDSVYIKVISVEFNLIPEGKLALIAFMETKGYIVAEEVYHDCIFVHKSLNYTNTSVHNSK